jgi:hypothetical protein
MIASKVPVLPLALLAILVAINAISSGCILSLARAKEGSGSPSRQSSALW